MTGATWAVNGKFKYTGRMNETESKFADVAFTCLLNLFWCVLLFLMESCWINLSVTLDQIFYTAISIKVDLDAYSFLRLLSGKGPPLWTYYVFFLLCFKTIIAVEILVISWDATNKYEISFVSANSEGFSNSEATLFSFHSYKNWTSHFQYPVVQWFSRCVLHTGGTRNLFKLPAFGAQPVSATWGILERGPTLYVLISIPSDLMSIA